MMGLKEEISGLGQKYCQRQELPQSCLAYVSHKKLFYASTVVEEPLDPTQEGDTLAEEWEAACGKVLVSMPRTLRLIVSLSTSSEVQVPEVFASRQLEKLSSWAVSV